MSDPDHDQDHGYDQDQDAMSVGIGIRILQSKALQPDFIHYRVNLKFRFRHF